MGQPAVLGPLQQMSLPLQVTPVQEAGQPPGPMEHAPAATQVPQAEPGEAAQQTLVPLH
jgi:hypothetical protein